MAEAVRQWKRRAQVIIGKAGSGIQIEHLRIAFEVMKTAEKEPNKAVIKIYNLAPDNEARIKNEYDDVLLNCGYEGALRLVFRGNIQHVFRYREGNDFITEIEAGDGDKDFRTAIMNETLAAGTDNAQLAARAAASFSGGTQPGAMSTTQRARRRGKVVSGATRNILTDLSKESGANWSIQDAQLTITQADDFAPGEAIKINADTGMLDTPEINDKGIAVKCLLNPLLKVNCPIWLDNNGIKALRKTAEKPLASARERAETNNPFGRESQALARLDPDGIYKVIKLTHKGDTHGGEWVSESECIGIDRQLQQKGKKK
jgi:hypothetical protein